MRGTDEACCSLGVSREDTYAQILEIAITVRLPHEGLGPVVFALHKPVRDASGQKLERGQDFLLPFGKGRKSLAHRVRSRGLAHLAMGELCQKWLMF